MPKVVPKKNKKTEGNENKTMNIMMKMLTNATIKVLFLIKSLRFMSIYSHVTFFFGL